MDSLINRIEKVIRWLGVIVGLVAILTPVLGYRRYGARQRGRKTTQATSAIKPGQLIGVTTGYLAFGILAWRPLPLRLPLLTKAILIGLGSCLYFPGVGLYLWGYNTLQNQFSPSSSFGAELYQDQRLIIKGPYRYMRHPMYLGVLMTAAGAFLLFRTWAMLVYSLSALAVILRARREDELLAEEFGPQWQTYANQVAGWLPKIF